MATLPVATCSPTDARSNSVAGREHERTLIVIAVIAEHVAGDDRVPARRAGLSSVAVGVGLVTLQWNVTLAVPPLPSFAVTATMSRLAVGNETSRRTAG